MKNQNKFFAKSNKQGFTLLEVIVTLMIVPIVGIVFYEFMGTSLFQSGACVDRVKKEFELQEVIEMITADYRDGMFLPALKDYINEKSRYEKNYEVKECKYIDFNSGTEEDSSNKNHLKIAISNDEHTLTSLFTQW